VARAEAAKLSAISSFSAAVESAPPVAVVTDRRERVTPTVANALEEHAPSVQGEERKAEPSAWPDDTAEAAFLADARERGEVVQPPVKAVEAEEEKDNAPLPPLDGLVQRIPTEVRETLEELFRAKFIAVRRVPKKALKN
jgi:hypothetical protein